jgi:hypothetical protein
MSVQRLKAENALLMAEVDRLMALVESNLNKSKVAMAKSDACIRTLEEQVERLTEAGDYLACHISIVSGNRHFDARDEWLRAKKGFPSRREQWEIEKRNRAAEDAAKEGKPNA